MTEVTAEQADQLAELQAKVAELEARIAEAGRRALFWGAEDVQTNEPEVLRVALAEVGRALLFDTETPAPDA